MDQEVVFRRNKEYSDAITTAELAMIHGLKLDPTKAKFLVESISDVAVAKMKLDQANKEFKDERRDD